MVTRIYTSKNADQKVIKTALSAAYVNAGKRRDHIKNYRMTDQGFAFSVDQDKPLDVKATVSREGEALNTMEKF